MSLVILGATIIDGVAAARLEGRSIWIEGGRIKAIGGRDELGSPSGAKTIDARGKYVIPGLMNANVHLLCDVRLENLGRHMGHYEDLIAEAAQVALRNGLTTVFDTWGPRRFLMAVRDRIHTGELPGSRIFCAGNIIGFDGPFSPDFFPKASEVANARNLIPSGASLLLANDGSLFAPEVITDPVWSKTWVAAPAEDSLLNLGTGHFAWFRAMEEKGCPPMAMLQAATRNIAVAYGKDKDLGTLESGKIADLLILDKDPLQAAENYRSIHMILKDSAVVDRDALPLNPILTKPMESSAKEEASYVPFLSAGKFPHMPVHGPLSKSVQHDYHLLKANVSRQ